MTSRGLIRAGVPSLAREGIDLEFELARRPPAQQPHEVRLHRPAGAAVNDGAAVLPRGVGVSAGLEGLERPVGEHRGALPVGVDGGAPLEALPAADDRGIVGVERGDGGRDRA